MRNKFLAIAAVLFSTLLPVTAAADDDKDEDVIFILIDKIGMPGQPIKRSMDIVPVECVYYGIDRTVNITYLEDIGSVSVTVTNRFTGETFIRLCDSSEGTSVIQTTGLAGDYHICIETAGGRMYEGDFHVE